MLANAQIWGGLFWLAIGAYVAWSGWKLDLGKLSEPGSGFALFWLGLIMCALSANEVVKAAVKGGETFAELWKDTRWQKVLLVTVMLLVFGFAFEAIGFIVCSLAMLLILMLFVDPVEPRRAILVSVLSTFVVWATLTEALKIQMPAGVLAGRPEELLRGMVRTIGALITAVIR